MNRNLCVCSIDEDGTIHPINNLWLTEKDATSLLLWMKQGPGNPESFHILEMGAVDLEKLSFKYYVPECQEQMMKAFKLEKSRKLALDNIIQ